MDVEFTLNSDRKVGYNFRQLAQFTDTEGRTGPITTWGLYHLDTINKFNLTTLGKAVDWLYKNKVGLSALCDTNSYVYDALCFSISNMTVRHVASFYDSTNVGRIKEIISDYTVNRLDHALWTNVSRVLDSNNTQSTSSSFVLYTHQEVEEVESFADELRFEWIITTPPRAEIPQSRDSNDWNTLKNYTFKMDPDTYNFFRGTDRCKGGTLYFGMELEISTQLSPEELYKIVTEVKPIQEPFFICKEDSSVSGCYRHKIELVTVPCTPRYLRQAWSTFFRKIEKLCGGKNKSIKDFFDVSETLTNGIHIHVGNDAFETELHKKKFCTAFNLQDKFSSELFSEASSRTDYKNNRYCQPSGEYKNRPLAYNIRNGTNNLSGHHNTISLQSGQTTEVRLYQGIFNLDHVLKCIDFNEAVFDYCAQVPFRVLNWRFTGNLKNFVMKSCKYRNYKRSIK